MEDKDRRLTRPRPAKLKFVNKDEVEEFINIVELLKNNNFRVINNENDRFSVLEAFSFYVYKNTYSTEKLKALCFSTLKRFYEEESFPCELQFLKQRPQILNVYQHTQSNIVFEGVGLLVESEPIGPSEQPKDCPLHQLPEEPNSDKLTVQL
jgi:hypothetical protein